MIILIVRSSITENTLKKFMKFELEHFYANKTNRIDLQKASNFFTSLMTKISNPKKQHH